MNTHETNVSLESDAELLEIEQLIDASFTSDLAVASASKLSRLRNDVTESIQRELDLMDDDRWLFWLSLSTIFLLASITISYFLIRESDRSFYARIESRPLSSTALAMIEKTKETSGEHSAEWLEKRIRADRRNRVSTNSLRRKW